MTMYISEVAFWDDTGYQEGGYALPSGPAKLPTPSMVYTVERDIHPPRSDLMVSMSLPIDWIDLYRMTYLRAVFNDGADTFTVYGWIDSVEQVSGSRSANTRINWHIDEWMTWFSAVRFGEGMVMRRPLRGDEPPQPYPHMYETVGRTLPLVIGEGVPPVWWVYLVYSVNTVDKHVITRVLTYPVSNGREFSIEGTPCPTFADTAIGAWDEDLGLLPENVRGAFICPMSPTKATINGDAVDMIRWVRFEGTGTKAAFTSNFTSPYDEREISLGETIETTDVSEWVVRGFDGEVIGNVPFGVPISSLRARVVMGSVSGYIEIRSGSDGHAEGTCWTVPMIPLELTGNGVSTYNYSGTREADRAQMRLDADQARVNGHLGVANGVIGGAVGGAISGNPLGAVLGGAGGAVANVASTEISYRYAVGEFSDRSIGIAEYRAAHQPNGLLMSGSGLDAITHGLNGITLARMDIDGYSKQVRADDITQYGAHVSEPVTDCSALIEAGGPLQIANLSVLGAVPSHARSYIKTRFQGGLRIE